MAFWAFHKREGGGRLVPKKEMKLIAKSLDMQKNTFNVQENGAVMERSGRD